MKKITILFLLLSFMIGCTPVTFVKSVDENSKSLTEPGQYKCNHCINGKTTCQRCTGIGSMICSVCGGSGFTHGVNPLTHLPEQKNCTSCIAGRVQCNSCFGSGTSNCTVCGGDGIAGCCQ